MGITIPFPTWNLLQKPFFSRHPSSGLESPRAEAFGWPCLQCCYGCGFGQGVKATRKCATGNPMALARGHHPFLEDVHGLSIATGGSKCCQVIFPSISRWFSPVFDQPQALRDPRCRALPKTSTTDSSGRVPEKPAMSWTPGGLKVGALWMDGFIML